ncbi:TRL domain-containing protein [Leptospira sp. 96542]|nr:TRL domain-containing protein [Leptospira sp. 96542]
MRQKFAIIALASFLFLVHCINLGQPQGIGPTGLFYANYTLAVSETKYTTQTLKFGKACVERIGIFYTRGNAGILAAAYEGSIQQVYRVEKEATNILSLYSKLCTIVWGL